MKANRRFFEDNEYLSVCKISISGNLNNQNLRYLWDRASRLRLKVTLEQQRVLGLGTQCINVSAWTLKILTTTNSVQLNENDDTVLLVSKANTIRFFHDSSLG